MSLWFVLRNEDVSGPLSTDEVKTMAALGQLVDKDLIWGRLQNEWKPLAWWMIEVGNLIAKNKEVRDPRLWHYAINGASFGPFTRDDLVVQLKDVVLSSDLLLWTKGMKAWAPIFEFNDVLDAIGVNKRQFPRADIEGKLTIKMGTQVLEGTLQTVSEGGFGATGIQGLTVGQVLPVELESDAFYDPLHLKAEVRYITDSGYVGFKFQNLGSEARSAVVQYVRGYARTMVKAA
jgi:hypothetical protein